MRPLTAAEYKESGSASALGCDFEKCLPHWHTRDFGMTKIFCGFFEVHSRARHESCHHAVGKSRHHVGLEGQCRNVLDQRGEHGRA